MRRVSKVLQSQNGLKAAHVPALGLQAVRLRPLRQGIHKKGSHDKALRHSHQEKHAHVVHVVGVVDIAVVLVVNVSRGSHFVSDRDKGVV